MAAAAAQDAQPSDAEDEANDAAAGEAAAAKLTGTCPTCRSAYPKKIKLLKGVIPSALENPNCVICGSALQAGQIVRCSGDCASFACVKCYKEWQAACKKRARDDASPPVYVPTRLLPKAYPSGPGASDAL